MDLNASLECEYIYVYPCHGSGMDGVNRQVIYQIQLLRAAVGNVIDENKNVEHITMPEIWQWLDDILGMTL